MVAHLADDVEARRGMNMSRGRAAEEHRSLPGVGERRDRGLLGLERYEGRAQQEHGARARQRAGHRAYLVLELPT